MTVLGVACGPGRAPLISIHLHISALCLFFALVLKSPVDSLILLRVTSLGRVLWTSPRTGTAFWFCFVSSGCQTKCCRRDSKQCRELRHIIPLSKTSHAHFEKAQLCCSVLLPSVLQSVCSESFVSQSYSTLTALTS